MEKIPEFKIFGDASEKQKKRARKELEKRFLGPLECIPRKEQEEFRKLEYPKSEKERAIIHFANKESSKLMEEAGLESYNIPEENIFIFPPGVARKYIKNATGRFFPDALLIILNAEDVRGNNLLFGMAVFHELLHFKGFSAVEVKSKKENKRAVSTFYRKGVTVWPLQSFRERGKTHYHFDGLEEAIVAEAERRLFKKLLDLPELQEERKWLMSDEAKEKKKKISEEEGIPEDDIIWVEKEGKRGGKKKENFATISYPLHREVLNYVCTQIKENFSDRFKSPDDVYKVFLNAHFTGKLLEIGRLVEETFGEGSFRLLSNMGNKREDAQLCLESLRAARARMRRKLQEEASQKEKEIEKKGE